MHKQQQFTHNYKKLEYAEYNFNHDFYLHYHY